MFFNTKLSAFSKDSVKVVHPPKHYFNQTYFLDYYTTGTRLLDTTNTVSKRLHSYKVSQFVLGFNVPIVTKDFYNKDSTKISNVHFLLTGAYSSVRLNFGGISPHVLSKFSIGFRGMYNNGKKSIFFIEASPFVTQDRGYSYTKTTRLAATFIYNCAVNPYFSFRLGITRSFLWGNRDHLPYVGIRVGKLDGVNFSVQFPRSVTFNVPIGKHVRASLFTKPQGGLYTFGNSSDSVAVGNVDENKTLYFGRNEFLSGARLDVLPSKHFSFYLSGGFTTKNNISLYASKSSKNSLSSYQNSYREKIDPSIFFNAGLVFRFGKTRSVFNTQQMYNAMDLNNSIDAGDNGVNPGNSNIHRPATKIKKVSTDEVLDLIETQDLY